MALITIQPSSSYSPLDKGRTRRRGTSNNGNGGYAYSYPICLTIRFLFLASLVTCWIGFYSFTSSNFWDHAGSAGGGASNNFHGNFGGGRRGVGNGIPGGENGCNDNSLAGGGRKEKSLDRPPQQYTAGRTRDGERTRRQASQREAKTAAAAASSTRQAQRTRNQQHQQNDADTSAAKKEAESTENNNKSNNNDSDEDDDDEDIDLDTMLFVENRILIAPGELPGYTGWARPERTLAGQFQITAVSETKGKTREEWFVDLECTGSEECTRGNGSLFYLRAYGPSIITGKIIDNGNGSYRALFYPTDPGRYTVEVVLEFSDKPSFDMFPVGVNDTELAYEGWLLPGFPMQITVEEADDTDEADSKKAIVLTNNEMTWCSFDELLETDTDSGRTKGRWKVVDNVRTKYHRQITPDGDGVSYLGYQHGLNSLGIKLKYENNNCKVLTYARANRDAENVHLVDRCFSNLGIANSPKPEDQIHVVFVGCSVMRLMHSSFDFLLRKSNMTNVRTSLVDIRRGLFRTLPHMKQRLTNFTQTNPDEKRFVIFNTGLHDIDRLCSGKMWAARLRDQEIMGKTIPEGQPCVETYRQQFQEMVQFIGKYPAELKVFRSTTPGWMKYGNYGFSWPTDFVQPFQRSHHMVTHINEVAFDVLANADHANDIHIMDGFWTSLARPDNTEMGPRNQIGKHMVHPGVEVMDALARKWMQVIVRYMCSDALDM